MEHLVVGAVLPMERDALRVVLHIEVVGVHQLVFVAKERPHTMTFCHSLLVRKLLKILETLLLHLMVFLHDGFRNHEFLDTILTRILEHLLTRHTVSAHGIGNLESRIDEDTVVAIEHLCVHTSHRCTDNQIGLLPFSHRLQHGHSFSRMYRDILGHYSGIGQHLLNAFHRARLTR